MPVVVLQEGQVPGAPGQHNGAHQEADAGKASARIVADLHSRYRKERVRCRTLPVESGQRYRHPVPESRLPELTGKFAEYGAALVLVRTLATPDGWDNADRSPYRPYSFPRSTLLSAIEEAVAGKPRTGEGTTGGERPDQQAAFNRLKSLRPRKPLGGPMTVLRSLVGLLAPILGIVVTVELTSVSTPELAPLILVLTFLVVLAAWGVLVFRQSLTAPLSGIFPASHWFATSTFILAKARDEPDDQPSPRLVPLATLLPGSSRQLRAMREERARMIVSQLSTAYYGSPSGYDASPGDPAASDAEREIAIRFYLSLRVHALLEDLRANYQPWALDMRRRKRRWPPILFLPRVDEQLGCVRFVQAVSDLRSRRSETDPLLILASGAGPLTASPSPEPDDSSQEPYQRWIGRLRIEQSPSQSERLPWVLLQEVETDSRRPAGRIELPRAGWSLWNLWSPWTVLVVVLLLCVGGYVRSQQIGREYCGGWLFGHDPDLVLIDGECIGVQTANASAFLPAGAGVTLSGDMPVRRDPMGGSAPASPSQVDLAYLEGLVNKQNQVATASPSHVTVVYAGALTAPAGSTDPQDALQELAGVYAWQYYVNVMQDDSVKLRVDFANDGHNAGQQLAMAKTVVAAANDDPTIEGVVGLDIDTKQAAAAVQEFANADLPVIATTISDDDLPEQAWNYFGLSPTNEEEAQSLVSMYAGPGAGKFAAVFERVGPDGKPADPYSQQQAQSGGKYLAARGFKLAGVNGGAGPITYSTQTNLSTSPNILQAICAAKPSVVYLAGRHGDMPQLAGLLSQHKQCFPPHVTVLSGDDMAVTEYPGTKAAALAPEMTLYYVAQTDPAYVLSVSGSGDNASGLNIALQKALTLNEPPMYSDAVFANGLMALGFDAADLLYNASTTSAGAGAQERAVPRAAVAPGLRCPLKPIISNGATGPLGFADVHHGLDFFEAVNAPGGSDPQIVTHRRHQPTVPGACAPSVAR